MDENSKRANKSQRLARDLKVISSRRITADNPFKDQLEATAKHIEWLELIVTGLTYAEKRTIAKLTRRVGTLERMIELRNEKLARFNDWHKHEKSKWRDETRKLKREYKRKLKRAEKIDDYKRHKIEKEFIKFLQTDPEIQQRIQRARWDGLSEGRQCSKWYDTSTTY